MHRSPHLAHAALACLLASCVHGAAAQGNSAGIGPAMQDQNPCLKQVSKFEQTIGFIRQNQGAAAAAELKERLLPAKLENDILMKDGYCGLARHLKAKKLID